MEQQEYLYDAFLSYRHLPADKAIAIRLQQLLERHKKPDGTPLRIFRDQSELPTSEDLGSDIRRAVEQSRYLIVIASPSYQQSKWCMAELQYFRSLHSNTNRHILMVLVAGEPETAFPEVLRWKPVEVPDADGSVEILYEEVEPLGADVRGDAIPKQKKLLRTEYLRIAAPLLGCSFDDLYQRANRRRRNQILAAVSAVAVLAVAFSIYSLYMLRQIQTRQSLLEAKQQDLYTKEARRLGDLSLELLSDNPLLAMLLAETALPENLDAPEYPIPAEAELAIRSAALLDQLHSATAGLRCIAELPFDFSHEVFLGFYQNSSRFLVGDKNHIRIFDAFTGQQLADADASYQTAVFSADANYYVTTHFLHEGEVSRVEARLFDSFTGACILNQAITEYTGKNPSCTVYWDSERQQFCLCRQIRGESSSDLSYRTYGFLSTDGIYTVTDEPVPDPHKDPDPSVTYETKDGRLQFLEVDIGKYAIWAAEEQLLLGYAQGRCFQSSDNHYFYVRTDSSLQIYSYDPERLSQLTGAEAPFHHISSDGSHAMRQDFSNWQQRQLLLYDTQDLSTPYFTAPTDHFRLTPDYRFLFMKDPTGNLSLLEVDTGRQLLSIPGPVPVYTSLGISPDGQLAAVVITEREADELVLYVYDTATAQCIYRYTDPDWQTYTCAHLEFWEGRLSVSFDYETYLFDLQTWTQPVKIPHISNTALAFMDESYCVDIGYHNGLLFVPGLETSAHGTRYRVNAIIDTQTATALPYHSRYDAGLERFCIDPNGEIFIDQETDQLIVQRRQADGSFREVLRIRAQDPTVELQPYLAPCDGRYLVLNGEKQTEIYDLSDGSLLYLLPQQGTAPAYYGVIDGVLYDLTGRTKTITAITLPDLEAARNWARQRLHGSRSFSAQELDGYYIPPEWAE